MQYDPRVHSPLREQRLARWPNKMKSWKSALVTWHKRQKEEDAKRQSLFPRASQSRPTYTNAEYHPERSAPPSTPQDDMAKWLALDHDNRAVLKRNFPREVR